MVFPPELYDPAQQVVAALRANAQTIATAESCTGGLICAALTAIPGSSEAVYGGFVTYANAAKAAMIDVPMGMIEAHGAVSREVALAMADGARRAAGTDFAIAVTGVAGPDGGTAEKPVGLVHFGLSTPMSLMHREERFGPLSRDAIRHQTVLVALEWVLGQLHP